MKESVYCKFFYSLNLSLKNECYFGWAKSVVKNVFMPFGYHKILK